MTGQLRAGAEAMSGLPAWTFEPRGRGGVLPARAKYVRVHREWGLEFRVPESACSSGHHVRSDVARLPGI